MIVLYIYQKWSSFLGKFLFAHLLAPQFEGWLDGVQEAGVAEALLGHLGDVDVVGDGHVVGTATEGLLGFQLGFFEAVLLLDFIDFLKLFLIFYKKGVYLNAYLLGFSLVLAGILFEFLFLSYSSR